jgi:predicted nuclease of predicted toxin-antitoxin system
MSAGFYFDEQVHGVLARTLARRGVDVLTAQQDHHGAEEDVVVFERAIDLGRVLVSSDYDMLAIAAGYLAAGKEFTGLLFLRRASIQQHLESLEYIAKEAEPNELFNTVLRLPL